MRGFSQYVKRERVMVLSCSAYLYNTNAVKSGEGSVGYGRIISGQVG